MTTTPPLFPPGTNMTGYVVSAAWIVVVGAVIFLARRRISAFLLRKTRAEAPDEERLRNFRKAIVFLSAFAVDIGTMGLVLYLGPPAWTFPVIAVGMFIAVICNLSFAYLLQSGGLKLFWWSGRK